MTEPGAVVLARVGNGLIDEAAVTFAGTTMMRSANWGFRTGLSRPNGASRSRMPFCCGLVGEWAVDRDTGVGVDHDGDALCAQDVRWQGWLLVLSFANPEDAAEQNYSE